MSHKTGAKRKSPTSIANKGLSYGDSILSADDQKSLEDALNNLNKQREDLSLRNRILHPSDYKKKKQDFEDSKRKVYDLRAKAEAAHKQLQKPIAERSADNNQHKAQAAAPKDNKATNNKKGKNINRPSISAPTDGKHILHVGHDGIRGVHAGQITEALGAKQVTAQQPVSPVAERQAVDVRSKPPAALPSATNSRVVSGEYSVPYGHMHTLARNHYSSQAAHEDGGRILSAIQNNNIDQSKQFKLPRVYPISDPKIQSCYSNRASVASMASSRSSENISSSRSQVDNLHIRVGNDLYAVPYRPKRPVDQAAPDFVKPVPPPTKPKPKTSQLPSPPSASDMPTDQDVVRRLAISFKMIEPTVEQAARHTAKVAPIPRPNLR